MEGLCDNEGFVGGGRRAAGVEDWVGWGVYSGIHSLAQKPQQMAAEQQSYRETLIVHSAWPTVKKHGDKTERTSDARGWRENYQFPFRIKKQKSSKDL